jgi:hypothetical protein
MIYNFLAPLGNFFGSSKVGIVIGIADHQVGSNIKAGKVILVYGDKLNQ